MTAYDNKFLTVGKQSGVRLTPIIEPVIIALDKYFEEANLKASVTSGERTSVIGSIIGAIVGLIAAILFR